MTHDSQPTAPEIPSRQDRDQPIVFALESQLDAGLLQEFRIETLQQLELAEIGVMALAGRPQDTELAAAVFRAYHTIKGMACFAGIPCIIELAHNVETFLDPFRRGRKIVERRDADLVLAASDILKTLADQVKDVQTTHRLEAPADYEKVRQHLLHPDALNVAADAPSSAPRPVPKTPQELAERAQTAYLLSVFQRVERLAAEFARREKKEVVVDLDCAEIKVDQQTAQLLSEALIHLLRNALAHGIESSEERFANGKPLAGRITLRAERNEKMLTVAFRDDGRGIDPQMVRTRAVELNLLPADADLDNHELLQLIFLPSFTMSPKPTELHGRGMGLDIVRKNVDTLGGNVEVRTHHGTEFLITFPLNP